MDDKDKIEIPNAVDREKAATASSNIKFSSRRVFVVCLVMRMANSLVVQTYFNPDEHWQALEVAHRIAFGYNEYKPISLCSGFFD